MLLKVIIKMPTNLKIKPLPIAKKWLILLNGVGLAMLIGAFTMRVNGEGSIEYLLIALVLLTVPFFAVARDLIINPVKHKLIWALFLSLFTFLASFIYLVVRDNIMQKQ